MANNRRGYRGGRNRRQGRGQGQQGKAKTISPTPSDNSLSGTFVHVVLETADDRVCQVIPCATIKKAEDVFKRMIQENAPDEVEVPDSVLDKCLEDGCYQEQGYKVRLVSPLLVEK